MAEMEENHANKVTLEIAQSLDEQEEEEYDEILTPLFSAPQDGCCVRCIKSVGNVITYSVGLLVTLLFSLLVWISVVIVYIFVKFRIHVIGLCCGKRKIVTKMKRVGWSFDYLVFHILFGVNFDKLLRVLLENPPTKYFITHLALIVFQTRYVLFLTRNSQSSAAGSNDCIPDYNLKHDYITYDTLYDCGRTTYSRLLPRCSKEHLTKLPPVDDVVNKLFLRDNAKHKFAPESELNLSILFGFYVRWFTHQFANTNERKHNYVGQPVGINLSQLYGASAAMEKHIRKYKNGELNSVIIDGQEFPPVINKFGFGGINSNSNSNNGAPFPCIVKAVSVETIGTTTTGGVHDLTLPYTPRQHHDLDDVHVENSDGNLYRDVSSPYLNSPREQEADTQSRSNNNNENNNEKKDKDKDKNGGVGDVGGAKRPSILSQSRFYHNALPKASTALELQTSSYKMFVNLNDKIFSSAYNDVAAVHGPDFFVIQLLFWRHHNYIARKLHKAYPDFDDEKIYQISKLCNIITCIKITLALYSDMGIVQTNLSAEFDFYDLENLYNTWMYKLCGPNRQLFPSNSTNVFIEFNFMYRWHQLVPPKIVMMNVNEVKKICTRGSNKKNNTNSKKTGEKKRKSRTGSATATATMIMVDIHQATDELSGEKEKEKTEKEKEKEKVEEQEELTLPYKNYVNMFTDEYGLERFLLSSSKTPAGKLCLNNTEEFLCKTAVKGAIKKSRLYGLESYNKYRERLGFEKYSSFEELTDDKETQLLLKEVYGDINMVEFYVGLFAETKEGKAIHGPFLTSIFASFVFSLITSSRLLRKNWNVMLTPVGKSIVTKYTTLNDLIYLHTQLNTGDINLRIKT